MFLMNFKKHSITSISSKTISDILNVTALIKQSKILENIDELMFLIVRTRLSELINADENRYFGELNACQKR